MVSESNQVEAIGLPVLGGRSNPDLSSNLGDMANQFLRSCGASEMGKSELAIVGTAGCWPLPTGAVGFACEDRDEAQLKAKLAGWAGATVSW